MNKDKQDIFWSKLSSSGQDDMYQLYDNGNDDTVKAALEELFGENIRQRHEGTAQIPLPGEKVRVLDNFFDVKTIKTVRKHPKFDPCLTRLVFTDDSEAYLRDTIPYERPPIFKEGDLVVVPSESNTIYRIESYEKDWNLNYYYRMKVKSAASLVYPEDALNPYPFYLPFPRFRRGQQVYTENGLATVDDIFLAYGRSCCGYRIVSADGITKKFCIEDEITFYTEPKFKKGDLFVVNRGGFNMVYTVASSRYCLESSSWLYTREYGSEDVEFEEWDMQVYPKTLNKPKFNYGDIVISSIEDPMKTSERKIEGITVVADYWNGRAVLKYHTTTVDGHRTYDVFEEDELVTTYRIRHSADNNTTDSEDNHD